MGRKRRSISPAPAPKPPTRPKTTNNISPPVLEPITAQTGEYQSDPSNIFELCTTRGPIIRHWFDNLRHILARTDVNFVLTSEGIDVSHADQAKNVVIVSKLFGKEFELYRCDTRISAGVDVEKLYKIVRFVQSNEILSLYIHRDKPGTLVISTFNGPTGCHTKFIYELIEEVPDEEVKMPDFAFPRSMTIPSQPFQKKMHDMGVYGVELVEIQSIRDSLILRNFDTSAAPMQVTFKGKVRVCDNTESDADKVRGTEDCGNHITSEIYQGVFNLKHICDFVKKTAMCEEMNFFIRNDLPLLIEFNVSSLGYLRIFILPVKST